MQGLHRHFFCANVRTMNAERIRFELRLKEQHRQALENLAEKLDVTMSDIVSQYIKSKAKREGCWPK